MEKDLDSLVAAVSVKHDADVLLYSGSIDFPLDELVLDLCRPLRRRPNVVLVLSTYGGAADAAYRIARCLQRNYKNITVIVDGFCKSAGTLLALGSDELVLSDYAELGPLDVQILKDDDVGVRRSGLTPTQALLSLAGLSFNTFRQHFLKMRFEMQLPTRMAAQVASEMSIGAFKEIYNQVDPMRLGEIDRAMNVALAYADRLTRNRGNLKKDTLGTLLVGYPSHEFVIDRQEASDLFTNVRCPSTEEEAMITELGEIARTPPARGHKIEFLSKEEESDRSQEKTEKTNGTATGSAGSDRSLEARAVENSNGADRANEPKQSSNA